ncbi:MAG: hypothetical protein JF586_08205 [Burkholderiales bacterium]|nr:hypothetical protein [Burkholderiales bacterium]
MSRDSAAGSMAGAGGSTAPRPGNCGSCGNGTAMWAGGDARRDVASAPPNTSGFSRTGTPVTAVMRSAMVRKLTLPPVAASSKFRRTDSVKMLGSRSPLPMGTLTDPTQALRARRRTGGAACSAARRSASDCDPVATAPCCASVRSPCSDAVPMAPAAWSACTCSETPGAAHPASVAVSNNHQVSRREAFDWAIIRITAPRTRTPARRGA